MGNGALCSTCTHHQKCLQRRGSEELVAINFTIEDEITNESSLNQEELCKYMNSESILRSFNNIQQEGGSQSDISKCSKKSQPVQMLHPKCSYIIAGKIEESLNVYEALDSSTGDLLICKIYQKTDSQYSKISINRLKQYTQIQYQCSNLEKIKACKLSNDTGDLQIFKEFVSDGSLKCISQQFRRLPDSIFWLYTIQILRALQYLHNQGIVHGNLKSSNVLLNSRQQQLKLSTIQFFDQDSASLSKSDNLALAPEILLGEKPTYQSDIWSVGCILLEMLLGQNPWKNESGKNMTMEELINVVKQSNAVKLQREIFSESAFTILNQCLQYDPRKRKSANELLQQVANILPTLQQASNASNFSFNPHNLQSFGCDSDPAQSQSSQRKNHSQFNDTLIKSSARDIQYIKFVKSNSPPEPQSQNKFFQTSESEQLIEKLQKYLQFGHDDDTIRQNYLQSENKINVNLAESNDQKSIEQNKTTNTNPNTTNNNGNSNISNSNNYNNSCKSFNNNLDFSSQPLDIDQLLENLFPNFPNQQMQQPNELENKLAEKQEKNNLLQQIDNLHIALQISKEK